MSSDLINDSFIEKIISSDSEKVFGVAEFSILLKSVLDTSFNKIKIKGEIQGLKKHSSGTYYFDLKENYGEKDYILNCVLWKYTHLNVKLEDGLEVILTGKITVYTGRSSYQITVENVEVAGIGSLLKIIEERKNRFLKEGLFDDKYKKPIPFLPKIVGVITSSTGAVIKDILHRIKERCPVHVLLYPVMVQGEGADLQIADAIYNFNKMVMNKPDVLIIARGGGSVQDLMPFNEESVVRAVFSSNIPVISAVGHETDTTLIDFVSDLRAPTPTGAAEKVVPVKRELIFKLNEKSLYLSNIIFKQFENYLLRLSSLFNVLKNPIQLFTDFYQRIDEKSSKLEILVKNKLDKYTDNLKYFSKMLESYSFKNILSRGFSIVWNGQNVISSKKDLENVSIVDIEFNDGKIPINLNRLKNINKRNNLNLKESEYIERDLFDL